MKFLTQITEGKQLELFFSAFRWKGQSGGNKCLRTQSIFLCFSLFFRRNIKVLRDLCRQKSPVTNKRRHETFLKEAILIRHLELGVFFCHSLAKNVVFIPYQRIDFLPTVRSFFSLLLCLSRKYFHSFECWRGEKRGISTCLNLICSTSFHVEVTCMNQIESYLWGNYGNWFLPVYCLPWRLASLSTRRAQKHIKYQS